MGIAGSRCTAAGGGEPCAEDRTALETFKRQDRVDLPSLEVGYGTHPDVTMHGTLPIDFAQIWRDAQQIILYDQAVWVRAPEDLYGHALGPSVVLLGVTYGWD
jgi:hypothetical protein